MDLFAAGMSYFFANASDATFQLRKPALDLLQLGLDSLLAAPQALDLLQDPAIGRDDYAHSLPSAVT